MSVSTATATAALDYSAELASLYAFSTRLHFELARIRREDPSGFSDSPDYEILSAIANNTTASISLLRVLSNAAGIPA